MKPLGKALIAARPNRCPWSDNWPHPMHWDALMPNDGILFDQFMEWAGNEDSIRRILVDNPAALYGFE